MGEGIFDIKQAKKLDNPDRINELKPLNLLRDLAGITNGYTCIDFGSGTGTFALPMLTCPPKRYPSIMLV